MSDYNRRDWELLRLPVAQIQPGDRISHCGRMELVTAIETGRELDTVHTFESGPAIRFATGMKNVEVARLKGDE